MKKFFKKHKDLVAIVSSVAASVFLVALVVSAATTIGADINTAGTLTAANSTLGDVDPSANASKDLGSYGTAWRNIYTSGTVFAANVLDGNFLSIGNGSSTSTVRAGATVTSTFTSGIEFNEASATTTLSIGHLTAGTIQGQGGCLSIGSTSSTPAGISFLNVYVAIDGDGELYLATSTSAKACY